jgi:hypothetical protein
MITQHLDYSDGTEALEAYVAYEDERIPKDH